jgi:hypothetical protein
MSQSKLLFPVMLVSMIVLGSISSVEGQPSAKIVVEGPTLVNVCKEFTVNIWIRDLSIPMNSQFQIRIVWDPNYFEYVSHTNNVADNGWYLDSEGLHPDDPIQAWYELRADSGGAFGEDASWATITFHCVGAGISEIQVDEASSYVDFSEFVVEAVDLQVSQVEPAPVGGYTVPTNKIELLAPYLALTGLIAVVLTVVVISRRSRVLTPSMHQ